MMTCLTLTSAAESVRSRFDEQTVVWTASTSDGIVTAASRRRAASSHSTETAAQTTASLRRCLTSQVRVFSAIDPSFTRQRQQLRQLLHSGAVLPPRYVPLFSLTLYSGAVSPVRYVTSLSLTLRPALIVINPFPTLLHVNIPNEDARAILGNL